MNNKAKKVLKYWRNSLADISLMSMNVDTSITINNENLLKGNIYKEDVRKLMTIWNDNKPDKFSKKDTNFISIAIAPIVLSQEREHTVARSGRNRDIAPLWIPALLSKDGKIYPDKESSPFISRECLAPIVSDIEPFGNMKDVDAFLSREGKKPENFNNWSDVINYVNNMWSSVVGGDVVLSHASKFWAELAGGDASKAESNRFWEAMRKDLGFEQFDYKEKGLVRKDPIVVVNTDGKGTPESALISLYDKILEKNTVPLLIDKLLSYDSSKKKLVPKNKSLIHTGNISNSIALNKRQRDSIYGTLLLKNGEILEIDGPPGTGKTTIFNSIIASKFVESVITKKNPEILFICSNNNKAVVNVLDSLHKNYINLDTNIFERWLPDVSSYGLFMPSKSREMTELEKDGYLYAKKVPSNKGPRWEGLPMHMENETYLNQAKIHFSQNFNASGLGEEFEISKMTNILYKEVIKNYNLLKNIVIATENINLVRKEEKDLSKVKDNKVEILRRRILRNRKIRSQQLSSLKKKLNNIEKKHLRTKKLLGDLNKKISNLSFIHRLLSLNPFIKEKTLNEVKKIFFQYDIKSKNLNNLRTIDDYYNFSQKIHMKYELEYSYVKSDIESFEKNMKAKEISENKYLNKMETRSINDSDVHTEWLNYLKELSDKFSLDFDDLVEHPSRIENYLDISLRPYLFNLSARYWEGKWIIETENTIKNVRGLHSQNKQGVEERFRRFAKVTPCFVSTLYTLPKIMEAYNGKTEPMLNSIDLLLVDEAGQITPEVGVAPFALAKKATIVGDDKQIEPVWGITPQIDEANLDKEELLNYYSDFSEKGILSSSGSIIKIARNVSKYHSEYSDSIMLNEHFRCLPKIMEYFNTVSYDDKLICKRFSNKKMPFPELSYVNISDSQTEKVGNSRINEKEADYIVDWVIKNSSKLVDFYQKPINQILAVITPFKQQANLILRKLNDKQINLSITVGTVHALQGAEKPVILMSTVYDSNQSGPFFFEQSNMLNVAVSRAQDSFILITNKNMLLKGEDYSTKVLRDMLEISEENNESEYINNDISTDNEEDVSNVIEENILETELIDDDIFEDNESEDLEDILETENDKAQDMKSDDDALSAWDFDNEEENNQEIEDDFEESSLSSFESSDDDDDFLDMDIPVEPKDNAKAQPGNYGSSDSDLADNILGEEDDDSENKESIDEEETNDIFSELEDNTQEEETGIKENNIKDSENEDEDDTYMPENTEDFLDSIEDNNDYGNVDISDNDIDSLFDDDESAKEDDDLLTDLFETEEEDK